MSKIIDIIDEYWREDTHYFICLLDNQEQQVFCEGEKELEEYLKEQNESS